MSQGFDQPLLLHLPHISLFSISWSLFGLSSWLWAVPLLDHELQVSHSLSSPALELQAFTATLGSGHHLQYEHSTYFEVLSWVLKRA